MEQLQSKKIYIQDLQPGMYVSGLDRPWLDTPFSLQGFMIRNLSDVKKLGFYCDYVYVDSSKSLANLSVAATPAASNKRPPDVVARPFKAELATHHPVSYSEKSSVTEEIKVAQGAYKNIRAEFDSMVSRIGSGKTLNIAQLSEASATHRAEHKIALKKTVLDALSENSFELFYQPQIRLADGTPQGVEGLVRWNQRDHGVSPEELIGIIEQSGRMDEFFAWTLQTAVRESALWRGQNITTAINLSASCLHSPGLFETIESSLNLWGAEPSDLCIEVTESTIQQDLDYGFQVLKKIKQLGVKIAIDDFGTGYSSLEYFKFIPADELKIDKLFVLNMRDNQIDMDIVKLILDWGKRFGMETIAEGVEDAESMELLAALGCTYAQGYHIGKAMPADQLSQWLSSYPTAVLPLDKP